MLGTAIPSLENSLRFRVARQAVLAANLANADTPGYRRVDLHFDAKLRDAQTRLWRTHAGHQAGAAAGQSGYRVEMGPRGEGPDRNGVVLQREIVTASRNAGAFTKQAAVLSRLLVLLRVAVAGEPR